MSGLGLKSERCIKLYDNKEDMYMPDNTLDRPVRESSVAHIALALVLDVSASMAGEKIQSLNNAVNNLIGQMQSDSRLKDIVDLGIFVFGEKGKQPIYQGFKAMADCGQVLLNANDGSTYVVEALDRAVEMLRARCMIYDQGGGAYKPWIVLVTDGDFHDGSSDLMRIGNRMKQRENDNKLQFFGLGVAGYNRQQLELFTGQPSHIIDVKAANFTEFLSWVGRSFANISSKEVGAKVTLEPLVFTV